MKYTPFQFRVLLWLKNNAKNFFEAEIGGYKKDRPGQTLVNPFTRHII